MCQYIINDSYSTINHVKPECPKKPECLSGKYFLTKSSCSGCFEESTFEKLSAKPAFYTDGESLKKAQA